MALVGLFLASWLGAAHASAAISKIAAGGYQTVFLKADGTLWGLGRNDYSQLGDGTTVNRGIPVQISGGTGGAAVDTGFAHTIFFKTDGTLWAVGNNASGQLGDGTTTSRSIPVQVSGGASVTAIAAGSTHSMFTKSDGTLWAMGYNANGQLGDGTTTPRSTPVQVNGGTNVVAVAAGGSHTVFLKADGTLWAMGDNVYGQLGDGTYSNRSVPVQVSGGTNVAVVAAGYSHTVFLKTDGTLWGMGFNVFGQLGDGTYSNRSVPVQVSGGTNVVVVAAGNSHTVFLKVDGTLWAMGSNYAGQLGDGTTTTRAIPVQVSGGPNVTAVGAGDYHTIYLKADGKLWGVGGNSFGQLSNSNPAGVTTPAVINHSLLLSPIGAKTAGTGVTLSFTISASDSDNNTLPLTYSATNLPNGATFDPVTRVFSWSPTTMVYAPIPVTFNVTNGTVTASETVLITVVDATPPSTPTGLSATPVSPTSISLTWTPSTDNINVSYYRVYRNGTRIGTGGSVYSDPSVQPGTTYSYTVSAVDGAGNESSQSTPVSITTPLTGAQTRNVTNATTLRAALAEAVSNPAANFTIKLAAGTYELGSAPLPNLSIANTIIQGPLTEPYAIIDGAGVFGGVVFNVTASSVTISGITFKNVATHAITVQPGANGGSIMGCSFYGGSATAAILGRGCSNWMVILNDIYDIAGTTATAEPAIYFYEGSSGLSVANNLIQDCDRGIGFGFGASETNGNATIFNNMISDTRTVSCGSAGISLNYINMSGTYIDNNTVYQAGSYANAIECNNNRATITLRNNLTNKAIKATSSPVITATNNTTAVASWFKDPNDCDLRLASAVPGVVDAGTTISGLTIDIEGDARPSGLTFDIGADEYIQPVSPNPPPSPNPPAPASSGGGGGAPSVAYWLALIALGLARGLRQVRR